MEAVIGGVIIALFGLIGTWLGVRQKRLETETNTRAGEVQDLWKQLRQYRQDNEACHEGRRLLALRVAKLETVLVRMGVELPTEFDPYAIPQEAPREDDPGGG